MHSMSAGAPLWKESLVRLSHEELVTMVLQPRGRTAALGTRVLTHVGGLRGLARAGPRALAEVPGVGHARAMRMLCALELGSRVHVGVAHREVLHGAEDVARMMAPRLGGLDHEQMWVLSLDGAGTLRGLREVARGGRHGLVVTAREIMTLAVSDAASATVLVHNHPSGRVDPSPEDIAMTQAVAEAAEIVGIPLLDHVIVAAGGAWTSLLEDGHLDPAQIDRARTLGAAERRTGGGRSSSGMRRSG